MTADEFEFIDGANVDEEHPHGDLDRIELTGRVRPHQTIIYGEPIATMMEMIAASSLGGCLPERQFWDYDNHYVYNVPPPTRRVFRRTINQDNINNLRSDINYQYSEQRHVMNDNFMRSVVIGSASPNLIRDYGFYVYSLNDSESYPYPTLSGPRCRIERKLISAMCNDVALLGWRVVDDRFLRAPVFNLGYVNDPRPFQCSLQVSGISDFYLDYYFSTAAFDMGITMQNYRDFKAEQELDPQHWYKIILTADFFASPPRGIEMIKVRSNGHVRGVYAYLLFSVLQNNKTLSMWKPFRLSKSGSYWILSSDVLFSSRSEYIQILSQLGHENPPSPDRTEDSWSWRSTFSIDEVRFIVYG